MPEELYKHDGERGIALVEIFEGKAEWRRQRAVEHHDKKQSVLGPPFYPTEVVQLTLMSLTYFAQKFCDSA